MKLVLQHPYPIACLLACIAMLEGVTLEEVIRIAGSSEPPYGEPAKRLKAHFGTDYVCLSGPIIQGWGERTLGGFIREGKTMIGSVSSCIDPNYSHAVVIHEGRLYDPWHGIDPSWRWDRYIGSVTFHEFKGQR